ncbi:MAG: CDP-glycerol glycerophosphotransferase family protein [Clostridiales bacterium]|nr:CDP-glycerol glycerophosphotransferase family protein [Clostridiales bacterium]
MKLYIDPGTGSMLVTVLIGIAGAAVYSLRTRIMNMKTKIGGGKVVDTESVPFAVFSDNKRYFDVFAPILREMDQRERSVLYLTASEDDPVFSCGLAHVTAEYIGPGNRVFTRLNNLKATVLLSTTPGLDVYQWKRSPGVAWYVHIPHAASEVILYRMFGIDYYDAILLSGKYQERDVRELEELRGLPAKDIRIVGIPYMDEMAARLKREGPAPEHERTVLLAPSWGKSALFGVYGSKIIEVLLATGYHLIIRPHPHSFIVEKDMIESLMAAYPESDRIEWNRDRDNFNVLRRSDILVSDFSGVIFEFTLIYDKPVIYTDPDFDLAPYDAWWLKDKTLWTATALPRLGRELTEENMTDLKLLIDECIEDTRFAAGRQDVKAETWGHVSCGAALAADYLCETCDALLSGKEDEQ